MPIIRHAPLSAAAETLVMLLLPFREEDNVLRKNIESLRSSALSLMPEGLENGINPQDMADLIQFLQTFQDRM